MQAKNVSFYGGLERFKIVAGSWVLQNTWNSMRIAKHIVTCPGITKGNFRDPNAWTYTVDYSRDFHGHCWIQNWQINTDRFVERGTFGNSSSSPIAPAWDKTSVYNLALSRLNEKIRGDLDLSIAIAERKQTYQMMKSLAKVFRHARNFRRFGTSKDVANGWLQWQYGWKPLMSDVFNIADESVRITINGLTKFKARAKKPIVEDSWQLRTVRGLPNFPVRRVGKGIAACEISVSLYVPSFDLSRWTSLNPVSIGWELIPYSFVVDWFFDVGSYLRNLETAIVNDLRFRTGYVSELYVYNGTEEVSSTEVRNSAGAYYTFSGTAAKQRYRSFVRTKLTSFPLPRKPVFRTDLGSQRLFSAAALLRQLLK